MHFARCGPGLLVVTVFLACAHPAKDQGAEGVPLSPLQLLPLREDEAAWAAALAPEENRFGLNLLGISAADAETVFLYGSVLNSGRRLRSFLAVSNDGGLTWQERLPPYESSEVTHTQLIGCVGWALVGWNQEVPGDLTLLGTADCGRQWHALSNLPKTDESGWPVALEFSDTFNGAVTLAYRAPDLERGYLRTDDGGRTWNEVLGRARPDEPGRIQRIFVAPDGTQWKLDTGAGRHEVRRRGSDKELWTVAAVLPAWLRAEDGAFTPL